MNIAFSESNEFPIELSSTRTAAASAKEINEITRTIHKTVMRTIPLLAWETCRCRIIIFVHQRNSEHIAREIDSNGRRIVLHCFGKPVILIAGHTIEVLKAVH